jgi:hypothetical protein
MSLPPAKGFFQTLKDRRDRKRHEQAKKDEERDAKMRAAMVSELNSRQAAVVCTAWHVYTGRELDDL